MIEDFREHTSPFDIQADVCIVGGGPAGITIARALAGTRHQVCLLESGGLSCEDDAQDLLNGRSVGAAGLHPAHSRLRVYGGSTRLWGGGCIPLTPLDFEPRDWVPHSGWPIRYQDLQPWYQRAHTACELHPYALLPDGRWQVSPTPRPLALDEHALNHRPVLGSPVEFGRRSQRELQDARNVRVLLHANLMELLPLPDGSVVREARIGSLCGHRGRVRARLFVLAAGGIENARLMLLSDSVVPDGLGNRHDLVGRFFQDHPRIRLGDIGGGQFKRMVRAYDRARGQWMSHLEICLSDHAQRSHRLLAARVRPFVVSAAPSAGATALRELRACLARASAQTEPDASAQLERNVADVLNRGLPQSLPPVDRRSLRPARAALAVGLHPADVVATTLRKLAHQPPLKCQRIDLAGFFEQAPNPDSRVTLDDSRDQLGLRRVQVDWRLTDLDHASHRAAGRLIGSQLAQACGARFTPEPWIEDASIAPEMHGTAHHIGTTRMADNPRDGVVDRDCRVHGVENLYAVGSSVFPTGGWAFPTFTIIALSLRLAEHLRSRLEVLEPMLML